MAANLDPYFVQLSHGAVHQKEAMKYEALRLSSFEKFPPSVHQSALVLASAGFFYTGRGDEVECFSCGLKVKDWNADDHPIPVHKKYSPSCQFVANNAENHPLASRGQGAEGNIFETFRLAATTQESDDASTAFDRLNLGRVHESDAVEDVLPWNTPHQQRGHRDNGPYGGLSSSPLFGQQQATRDSPITGITARDFAMPVTTQEQPPPASTTPLFPQSREGNEDTPNHRYERARLASYQNWPSNAAVRPEDLASAGFFYTGMDDRVQCVFCRGILRNWEPDDVPDSEHRRHFTSCPFMADPRGCGNVSLGDEYRNRENGDFDGFAEGVVTERPVHQKFARPDQRLATFKDFPRGEMTQTPEIFTKSGFFYSGIADNVKCFFCDGGLRNWEPNDDPWTEHARWFPRCGYLRLCKGDEFIKEVQSKFAPPSVVIEFIKEFQSKFAPPSVHKKPPRLRTTNVKRFPVNQKSVNKCMETRIVKAVLDMDFNKDKIRQVIIRRMEDLGDDFFPNAESLVDAIVEYDDEVKYTEMHAGDQVEDDQNQADSNDDQSIGNDTASKDGETKNSEKKKKKKKKNKNKNKNSQGAEGGTDIPVSDNNTTSNVGGDTGPMQYIDEAEANRLSEDVQRLKDERTCKICMDEEVNIVFLRCGHLVCCSNCAPAMRHCPICRELIRGTVRVFLS